MNQEGDEEGRREEQMKEETAPVAVDDQRPKEIITPRHDNWDERDIAEQEGESIRQATCYSGTANDTLQTKRNPTKPKRP